MSQLEVRTRTEDVYDGSTGEKIDTQTFYDLGAEIDGVFVAFLTKAGGYIDSLIERGKAAQQADQQAGGTSPASSTPPGGSQDASAQTVAPVIPADQAQADQQQAAAADQQQQPGQADQPTQV